MSLTTSQITGRIPLPDNSVPGSVVVVFTLNATDIEGVNVIPAESSARYRLTADGDFPAGAVLWRNAAGLRATSYRVNVIWDELVAGRPVTKDVQLGYVQLGNDASYSIADLLAAPSSGEVGWFVNVPQGVWEDFNARLNYMYSIAESSLPATVARAVEAEEAAALSAEEAALSAAAAGISAVDAVADVNAARDTALGQINPKVTEANNAATAAGNSATAAAGSATTAGGHATAAGNSATAAAGSATTAGDHATAAGNSATAAAGSATAAAGSATAAESSATAAGNSATAAETSAATANTRANAADTSANNAAASATAASGSAAAALGSASAAALSAGSANDARIATQALMDEFGNFRFLGKVEWWHGDPAQIPAGFLPANGQLLNRADYPDLWSDISNGVFFSVAEAAWQSDVVSRGRFSLGDGTTTFRMPDLNGAQPGSRNGAFLRGAKNPEGWAAGAIQGDAIRNLTGEILTGMVGNAYQGFVPQTGLFTTRRFSGNSSVISGSAMTSDAGDPRHGHFDFNASKVVPTAAENRPVSAVGAWIMLVNGAPGRTFNPETSAGLGSNTFGGLQKFNAGFEFVGIVPQLIQTDVDQGLTVAQKLQAASNTGAVSFAGEQTLSAAQRSQARANMGMGTPAQAAASLKTLSTMTFPSNSSDLLRFWDAAGVEWGILYGSVVKPDGGSADRVVSYGITFANMPVVTVTNGDATAISLIVLSVFNITPSSFAVTARHISSSAPHTGAYRINFMVMGRLS